MHPSPRFHIESREDMAALVRDLGFGILVAQTEERLRAVHVPVLLQGDRLRFHVSRGNLVHAALAAGCEALFVANGPHAYVSPADYGMDGRVPTWSYVSVELNGPVRPLGTEALVRLLDDLSAVNEERLAPKPAWTRADVTPALFQGLLKSISGFEMIVRDWRGTAKIDQDKPAEVRTRIADALSRRGDREMAALYASPSPDGEGDQAKLGGGVEGAGGNAPAPQRPQGGMGA
ncbi:MAG: FMN-binding negative transcriptional regulator [Allosphingosinicella sp.]